MVYLFVFILEGNVFDLDILKCMIGIWNMCLNILRIENGMLC